MPRPSAVRPPRRAAEFSFEDNRDAAESLAEVRAIVRHEVSVASSGAEGIAKARASRPDVVLCDIGLPGMSGYDVARALRAEGALRGALLVAVSGYSMPEDVQRASDAGFDCHLAKPPSLEKLEGLLGGLPASRWAREAALGGADVRIGWQARHAQAAAGLENARQGVASAAGLTCCDGSGPRSSRPPTPSDTHLKAGLPPMFRVDGQLEPLKDAVG